MTNILTEPEDTCDSEWEAMTGIEVEDALIKAYVPEPNTMSREDALALALQRDEEFAGTFEQDVADAWDAVEGYPDDLDDAYFDGTEMEDEDEQI